MTLLWSDRWKLPVSLHGALLTLAILRDGVRDAAEPARDDTSERAPLRTLTLDELRLYGGGPPASDSTSEALLDVDTRSASITVPESGSTSIRLLLKLLFPLSDMAAFEYRALACDRRSSRLSAGSPATEPTSLCALE